VIELTQGAARARLAPHLGGRVTALRLAPVQGRLAEVLHPFPEETTDLLRWPKGGLYPLVPYWGRIRDSRLLVEESVVQLTPHPDAAPHTLHGPAHRHPWAVEHVEASAAIMSFDHPGDAEWPWPFRTLLEVSLLSPDRCAFRLTLTNTGDRIMPAGLGLHPYFSDAGRTRVIVSAQREWPMDTSHLSLPTPAGPLAWDGALEGPVTRQVCGWEGHAVLRRPEFEVRLKASAELACLVLHRPRQADWLCLEPVSHVADAFNLAGVAVEGTGARTLAPAERLTAALMITASRD
jgi:aldose 1-epimerase